MSALEYNEDKILGMINEKIPEHLSLDYKSSRALENKGDQNKSEISRGVSSFANSAGEISYMVFQR